MTSRTQPRQRSAPAQPAVDRGDRVLARQQLRAVGLAAELRSQDGVDYLLLRSTVDPGQLLLLSLQPTAPPGGISSFTRLGRLHARYWAISYGAGPGPDTVHFVGAGIRFRRESTARPVPLGGYWAAAAEGVFATATAGSAQIALSRHW